MTRTLFLAVPGTQETRELALDAVQRALASGEITLDNWAWSAERNEWVPLSQLPEFAPVAAPVATPVPVVQVEAKAPVVMKASAGGGAATAVAMKVNPLAAHQVNGGPSLGNPAGNRLAGTVYSKPIREHNEFPVFKVLFVVLGLIIAALVGVNYGLVEKPFRDNLDQTEFKTIQAHAHLGAFIQPSVLLIHVMPSSQITPENFADFLTALTKSAPRGAISGTQFNTVGLTASWFGEYAITAQDWDGFADMSGFTPEQKKEYVLAHLERINGDPLVIPLKNETPEQNKARTDKVWSNLIAHFQAGA